jgi:tetrapyrrole methylase family protein/MazG family protein
MGGGPSLACGPDTFKEAPSSMYNVLAIPGSPMADSTGPLFEALLSLMGRLRAEGGCPWDREQTRASLRPYLIEETYETLEALDAGETGHIVEELGDLLFQVVFHCQIAEEQGEFTMADVLQALLQKMTRRHPHVFGNAEVADSGEALRQWERIKRAEVDSHELPRSALDGVPKSLPSLLRAQRLQVKAGRVGFDWPTWREAWSKVREEIAETDEAMAAGDADRIKAELGDLLFSLVNVARLLEIDAEGSLRQAADTFTRRFKEVEAAMRAEGRQVEDASAEELDRQWLAVKSREGLARSGDES